MVGHLFKREFILLSSSDSSSSFFVVACVCVCRGFIKIRRPPSKSRPSSCSSSCRSGFLSLLSSCQPSKEMMEPAWRNPCSATFTFAWCNSISFLNFRIPSRVLKTEWRFLFTVIYILSGIADNVKKCTAITLRVSVAPNSAWPATNRRRPAMPAAGPNPCLTATSQKRWINFSNCRWCLSRTVRQFSSWLTIRHFWLLRLSIPMELELEEEVTCRPSVKPWWVLLFTLDVMLVVGNHRPLPSRTRYTTAERELNLKVTINY